MAKTHDFRCPACGAEFDTREQLDNHGRREHPESGKKAQPPDESSRKIDTSRRETTE